MHILADLRAGAHRRPGVHHGAFIDIRTNVHIRRHQHHVPGDKRAFACRSRGHDAEAALAEIAAVVVGEFGRHLVVIVGEAAFDERVAFHAERQQHGFLQPLVRHPLTVDFFRDAQLALVELGDDVIDRFLELRIGIVRGDPGAVLKALLDGLLQLVHDDSLMQNW